LAVDRVARREGLLQRHAADHVAQGGGGQLLDADDVIADLVDRRLWVGHLEVDDRVDVHGQVVLGDHRLRRKGHHALTEVDPGPDLVDERQQQRQLSGHRLAVAAEALDDRGLRLRYERHGFRHHDRGEDHQHCQQDQTCDGTVHKRLLL
jgi:hypothetical protein